MKTLKTKLLTIALLLCCISANAYDFKVDDIYYNITSESDLTVEVTRRSGYYYTRTIEIPNSIEYNGKNYSVTSIGTRAFFKCTVLTGITIPNSVTSIGDEAFYGCSGLTSITIPNSVTNIGDEAFYGCSGLTSITIPNSVTYIGDKAFYNCSGLTSITIPNSVTSIEGYVFYGCSGLTSITIPNSVTYIGDKAFYNCSGLTSITIPNSVTNIGQDTFRDCENLKLVINYSDLDIKKGYYGAHGYVAYYADRVVTAGDAVGDYFFRTDKAGNHNLSGYIGDNTELKLPEDYKGETYSIGERAFYEYSDITSITIPNSVTSIGVNAFYGCSGLTSITIPNSVTNIGLDTFEGCENLKLVINYSNLDIGKGNSSHGYVAYYADRVVTAGEAVDDFFFRTDTDGNPYLSGYIGDDVELKLPDNYQGRNYSIGERAFEGCSNIASITIPNSVTSIGKNTFKGCGNLTNVKLGNLIDRINLSEFSDCSLKSLIIGAGVKNIVGSLGYTPVKTIWLTNTPPEGYRAATGWMNYVSNEQFKFSNNKTVVYPFLSSMFEVDGVMYVPVNMSERTCDAIDAKFNSSVENLNINATVSYKGIAMTVKEVMPYTFYENNYIKTLSVDNAGNIGEYAFFECGGLQTVTTSNQGEIGEYAFSDCLSLTSVILNESITNIKGNAFRRCSALTKMTIPNSVLTLGDNCFYGCTSMQSVELGNGLTNIGRYAFGNCSALSSISIPSSVTNVGDYVFDDCTAMTKVVIEDRTEALPLGTNGSEPLFADCPLNSVYIGGKISYSTKSSDGYSPFYRNTTLESVVISDHEETVYDNEFYGCTGLKNVTIGNGVKSIGNWAFSGCSSLDKFSFGGNVESIGKEAFSDCTGMTQLISYAVTPPTCGAQALEDINKWECTLKVPESCKAAYQEADQWKDFLFTEDVLATQKYTLTYTVDGEVYHTESIALNAAIPTIETPTKDGHTFNGWNELPAKMPAHDMTVEGSFTVNTYTITYKVDGKTYATEEVSYGSAITLKDAPEKEGHLFSGWSEVPETMPAHDVTVTGTFTVDGIEEIVTERLVDVYTLQGVIVKRQISVKKLETELPSGIYIVGGKKFVVK